MSTTLKTKYVSIAIPILTLTVVDNGSGFVEIGVLINTQPDSDEYTFEDKLNAIWPGKEHA